MAINALMDRRSRGDSMDTQKPIHKTDEKHSEHSDAFEEFQPGTPVIYALHGKCQLIGIESREMNGQSIRFYKLEIQKSALSRSTRREPAIWIPVHAAKERGLRAPLSTDQAEAVFKVLSSREYFFETNVPWNTIQPKLEMTIRTEGAIGLAKVASYLFVLKRKQVVPQQEAAKMQETVNKLLLRELSEATGENIRNLEDRIAKSFKQKLLPDH